jgi:D-alanyl-D-alanine carboxypeptidase
MQKKTILIISLFAVLIVSCKSTKPANLSNIKLEQSLQNKLDSVYHSNLESIGILLHVEYPKKNISWSGAVGYSNKETQTKIKVDQPVLIASNTKTFVAATILRLVEEEKLKLQSPIGNYLTERTREMMSNVGYDLKEIKISHLLSHTSGINDYTESPIFKKKLEAEPKYRWTRFEQIEVAILQMDKVGKPGYQYEYSDTNYLLLTEIIEQITGIEFYRAIRQLLDFEKNGINSTWFEGLESAPNGTLPISHQYIGKWDLDAYDIDKSFDLYGGGGIASTTRDLSVFIQKLFNGEIFDYSETINLLLTKSETEDPSNTDYRFGIWKYTVDGKTVYGHGGFWGSMVYYFPDLNITLSVVILNKDESHLRNEIAELVMKKIISNDRNYPK